MEGLVIRTLYNNQGWRAPCSRPYGDPLCYYCPDNKLNLVIRPPSPRCDPCDGECWEQKLCRLHCWGCWPSGRVWGPRAKPGVKVFFVFREVHRNRPRLYTLWGKTKIKAVASCADPNGVYLIHFDEFVAAPRSAWRSGLAAEQIVGKEFGSGLYRYIPNPVTDELDKMVPDS